MLSRAFISLYISVFVATLGISMVSPLLSVYARDLGASGVWLGLAFSSFAIVQTFVGPFAGQLSDKYGRKKFIVAGLLIYMIAAIGYLTAQSFYQVIAFRMFSGLGTSLIFSVSRAYVGDLTPRGQEGRWIGVYVTGDIVGFGTGPMIAAVMREQFGFHSVFVAMAALMALSALVVAVFLPRKGAPAPGEARREYAREERTMGLVEALKDRLTLALTVHVTIISLATGSVMTFLALRLENELLATPLLVGLAFTMQNFSAAAAQPLFGRVADRANRRRMVAIGLVIDGALLASLGFVPTYMLALVVLLAMSAGGAISQVAAGAMQVVAGRRVGLGTVLGLNSAGNGVGIVVGALVAGLVKDTFGLGAAFLFGGIAVGLGAVLFTLLTRGVPTTEREFAALEGERVLKATPVG